MKKFNLKQCENKILESYSINNDTHVEIRDKFVSFNKCVPNEPFVQHVQNIQCFLKEPCGSDDEQNTSDSERENEELKFKFAAIVIDRLFLYVALVYSILTFAGLVVSI